MSDHDLTRELEAWLAEPAPPLDESQLFQTIDRVHTVPQRRRWWPLRWFPLGLGATRSARPAGPHPEGRTNPMFKPITVAAGVAVLAVGGSLALIAGPLADPGEQVVPAAVTQSMTPEPVADGLHVEGRVDFRLVTDPPPSLGETTADQEDGATLYRDAWFQTTWTANDPRATGRGEYTGNSNTYPVGLDGDITVGWGTQSLSNDEGSWTSRPGTFGILDDDRSAIPVWFDGAGGYEGMTMFMLQEVQQIEGSDHSYFTFEGWILPNDRHFEDAVD